MSEEKEELVFVYGTLLTGEYNNYLMEEALKLGVAEIKGMAMVSLGAFPACFPGDNPEEKVVGEVWQVSQATFQRLDRLEGYPDFYDRMEVETPFGNAWIYINWHTGIAPRIPGGNWKEYLAWRRGETS